ncbi:hypothetical protein BV898_14424 [Hypsibius exemplaris]|uniref:Uncharacterized protein n=1 Tax=Hypsibius exemplaris TaxID=2072580 RepID=A0A9X6NAI7_HYPEX|nr:hypothetical protein BV898_14424 [Hypsibius exemplaris]
MMSDKELCSRRSLCSGRRLARVILKSALWKTTGRGFGLFFLIFAIISAIIVLVFGIRLSDTPVSPSDNYWCPSHRSIASTVTENSSAKQTDDTARCKSDLHASREWIALVWAFSQFAWTVYALFQQILVLKMHPWVDGQVAWPRLTFPHCIRVIRGALLMISLLITLQSVAYNVLFHDGNVIVRVVMVLLFDSPILGLFSYVTLWWWAWPGPQMLN